MDPEDSKEVLLPRVDGDLLQSRVFWESWERTGMSISTFDYSFIVNTNRLKAGFASLDNEQFWIYYLAKKKKNHKMHVKITPFASYVKHYYVITRTLKS